MGILSSLTHPANGDTAGERVRGEGEEETGEGKRPAKGREMATEGVPVGERAERWTHEDTPLREKDPEV